MADKDPAISAVRRFITAQKTDVTKNGWRTKLTQPNKVKFAPDKTYLWVLETSKGEIKIKLLPATAPLHVTSTLYLTELGFYNDLVFHRIIPGFMLQGGCPNGTGTGGPGYKYAGEYDPKVKHDKPGTLSMANSGPGTDGSQFFITFVPTPHLNGKHTVFGELYDGTTTLAAIEMCGSENGKPLEKIVIKKASVVVV